MLDLRCFKAHFGLRQAVFRFCLRSSHFIDLILLHPPCRVNRNREVWYRLLWTGPHGYELGCSCLSLHYPCSFFPILLALNFSKSLCPQCQLMDSPYLAVIFHILAKTSERNLRKIKKNVPVSPEWEHSPKLEQNFGKKVYILAVATLSQRSYLYKDVL